ncbi:MAG: pilus assembly protein [Bacilli bacterium]|nr:pilus assembly protein [Bacilli bacterium]
MIKERNLDGSLTVEASLAMPLFIFMIVGMLSLFDFYNTKINIQKSMYDISYEYATTQKKTLSYVTSIENKAVIKWDDEKDITYALIYKQVPFVYSPLKLFNLYIPMQVNDYSGESMIPSETAEEYVYITNNPTVYHSNVNCPYLSPNVECISFMDINTKRNKSGAKYYPCETCLNGSIPFGLLNVYITPYGTRYHKDSKCSQIYRNVRKVKKCFVTNLRPCGKCYK